MTKKRYAIIRLDNFCPAMLDDFGCIVARNMLHCKCGEDTKNYGDIKEQLIKKIAQVLFKRKLKLYRRIWGSNMGSIERKDIYAQCLEVAKKIVEFLGVEE